MTIVVDWDGTVTQTDTHLLALEQFGDPALLAQAEAGLQEGMLTLKQCIELEFSGLRVPLEDVNAWLADHARLRPGFHEFAERHQPVILSSGFAELIEPLLQREGLELELLANRVAPGPDGWRAHWRDEAQCDECGEPCKRGSLPGGEVVYVGDGWSDRCAALAAKRVFARDGLADYLEERSVVFERFGDFREIIYALER